MTLTEQFFSQLPAATLVGLRQTDELWRSLRLGILPVPTVVQDNPEPLESVDWDVVICGGTLGILMGAALAQRGWRVALLERGNLRGRDQEWNISRRELDVFVSLGLLTTAELEQAIATDYNPARISFLGGDEVWVKDVLNIGIDPVYLLETLKQKFLQAGGQLFEQTPFKGAIVHPNGAIVQAGDHKFSTRLVLDAMGHFSPIVQQARQGKMPDAVCLVVGSCATGFPASETGDLLVSFTPIQNQCQYFWEAFPARDGRTTYLFTYVDTHRDRPSLEALFEDYLRLMPRYQGVELQHIQPKRALFGFFPSYRNSPLQPSWNRILPIGDSSGSQSPLSFGGFGTMVRHLHRLTNGIDQALQADVCDRRALARLQPYQPNLSVTWLFQRTMSVRMDQKIAPNQINDTLSSVFQGMATLGDSVLKPFLQDVVQFPALFQALTKTALTHPNIVASVIPQAGIPALASWMRHYVNLAAYAALYPLSQPLISPWLTTLSPTARYYSQRWLDAFKYGSGRDYEE